MSNELASFLFGTIRYSLFSRFFHCRCDVTAFVLILLNKKEELQLTTYTWLQYSDFAYKHKHTRSTNKYVILYKKTENRAKQRKKNVNRIKSSKCGMYSIVSGRTIAIWVSFSVYFVNFFLFPFRFVHIMQRA